MIHLSSITLNPPPEGHPASFPFTVPIISSLDRLDFPSEVTFLVGENGSGKSTLLEAIACAAGLPTVGSEEAHTDKTLAHIRPLADALRLSWSKRTHRGFFMRTEDFFGFSKHLTATREEYERDLTRIEQETKDRSITSRSLARA